VNSSTKSNVVLPTSIIDAKTKRIKTKADIIAAKPVFEDNSFAVTHRYMNISLYWCPRACDGKNDVICLVFLNR
jgi:hypothetical protein